MRALTFIAGIGASLMMSATAFAGNQSYTVELDKTKILRLPGNASAVVVGNPDIADVSVHAVDTLFVVGRGFGQTNLIVLDGAGNTMMDANIQVTSTTPHNGVRLFNAKSRETYSCAPYCQPSPVLGDNPSYIQNNTAESEQVDPITALFRAAADASSQNGSSAPSALGGSASTNNGGVEPFTQPGSPFPN